MFGLCHAPGGLCAAAPLFTRCTWNLKPPIEKLFAKLKALLRKAATRTADELRKEIGRLLDRFTPDECTRYFASSGYVKT